MNGEGVHDELPARRGGGGGHGPRDAWSRKSAAMRIGPQVRSHTLPADHIATDHRLIIKEVAPGCMYARAAPPSPGPAEARVRPVAGVDIAQSIGTQHALPPCVVNAGAVR